MLELKKKDALAKAARAVMSWHQGHIEYHPSIGPRRSLLPTSMPDCTNVDMTFNDETHPGGPRVTRIFTAPFARTSREDDCRVAWAFFDKRETGAASGS